MGAGSLLSGAGSGAELPKDQKTNIMISSPLSTIGLALINDLVSVTDTANILFLLRKGINFGQRQNVGAEQILTKEIGRAHV